MAVETFPEPECLMREAKRFPRRHKTAQTLFQICSTEQHPFIRQLRWEDLKRRVLNPTPVDDLVDRLDLIKDKLIGIFYGRSNFQARQRTSGQIEV